MTTNIDVTKAYHMMVEAASGSSDLTLQILNPLGYIAALAMGVIPM